MTTVCDDVIRVMAVSSRNSTTTWRVTPGHERVIASHTHRLTQDHKTQR